MNFDEKCQRAAKAAYSAFQARVCAVWCLPKGPESHLVLPNNEGRERTSVRALFAILALGLMFFLFFRLFLFFAFAP